MDYITKNSTHPFRVFNSESWRALDTFGKRCANIGLLVYNAYTGLLGLAMMCFSAYLINRDNTGWAKLLMCVSCYLICCSLVYFALPNFISAKVCAAIWLCMNTLLLCFTLACCVMSFFPVLYEQIIKLDVNNNTKRLNSGLFFVHNQAFMNAATIIGTIAIFAGIACWCGLWNNFNDNRVRKSERHLQPPPRQVEMGH